MVRIVADTTSGLSMETLQRLDITLLPQIVTFGEESFRDDQEIDTLTFLAKLKTAPQLPKTAAPPPSMYAPIYEDAKLKGEEVIVITPSAKVSGTFRSAEVAARDFPDLDVHVVDSQTIAGNVADLVIMAATWSKEGLPTEKIIQRLKPWISRARTYFLVNTLEYLQKGGRIGGAKALLGELLQVKPILTVLDGQVETFEQQRTKKRALARLVEIVHDQCPRSPDAHLSVMHVEAHQDANQLADEFSTWLGVKQIPIYELPPAIVVHSGPGALAVGFFVKGAMV